ncbi:MAG: protein phosphatase 2C domain-containing protein [Micrococcus sp.]|nr:protein phosphatase 2C domain-containing protein [Micrococcus sp.]
MDVSQTPTTPRLTWAARTDVGAVRQLNEDSWTVAEQPFFVAAVADGMGGHEAGEEASAAAVAAVREAAGELAEPSLEDVGALVSRAHEAVESQVRAGAGTTLTLAACLDSDAREWAVANVGDSRIYRRPAGEPRLEQLTVDHSAVQMLVDAGELTPAEARVHPRRNVITRALGSPEQLVVDVGTLRLGAGDRLLLCSDGLTGELLDEEILALLDDSATPQAAVDVLVDAANWRGGRDNITAIVLALD